MLFKSLLERTLTASTGRVTVKKVQAQAVWVAFTIAFTLFILKLEHHFEALVTVCKFLTFEAFVTVCNVSTVTFRNN